MFPVNLTIKIRIVVYGEVIKQVIVDSYSLVLRENHSNADAHLPEDKVFGTQSYMFINYLFHKDELKVFVIVVVYFCLAKEEWLLRPFSKSVFPGKF